MKTTIILLLLSLGLVSASAQSELAFLEAFGTKDISTVSNLLNDKLTVCVSDNVVEVNRDEALRILKKFLAENTITKKKLLHNGKSSDKGSSYKVARITTDSGTYRVFAYSESGTGKSVIKEIRIDKM